ncbi:ParB/RepB/Spo0J family partition protein [Propionispora sp. 2/2-37]|uniref:ParB/RepB/Spo0J family partition protein n=1 Tax=Propionispora sp. 2/2-37 TaxID=1677858 RepID=UPI0009E8CE97|nr:ParB/RepB/Spo0J family partition protein [Propionispora sp. 2/2-37]
MRNGLEESCGNVGANASHGLRRTNADKRKAVMMLLQDEEWSKWSNVKIAEQCCVSDMTVGRLRKELEETHHQQSGRYEQPQQRKVKRNGTIYTQDTTNIGKTPFKQFIDNNKDKVRELAEENTVRNDSGEIVITKDDDWYMLSENLQRSDLTEVEKAEKLHEMMFGDRTITVRVASEKLGLSIGYISDLLKLHGYPTEIKEEIKEGNIGADTIRSINKLDTPEEQTKVVTYAIDNDLNRKQVDQTITIIQELPPSIRKKITDESEYTIEDAKEEYILFSK